MGAACRSGAARALGATAGLLAVLGALVVSGTARAVPAPNGAKGITGVWTKSPTPDAAEAEKPKLVAIADVCEYEAGKYIERWVLFDEDGTGVFGSYKDALAPMQKGWKDREAETLTGLHLAMHGLQPATAQPSEGLWWDSGVAAVGVVPGGGDAETDADGGLLMVEAAATDDYYDYDKAKGWSRAKGKSCQTINKDAVIEELVKVVQQESGRLDKKKDGPLPKGKVVVLEARVTKEGSPGTDLDEYQKWFWGKYSKRVDSLTPSGAAKAAWVYSEQRRPLKKSAPRGDACSKIHQFGVVGAAIPPAKVEVAYANDKQLDGETNLRQLWKDLSWYAEIGGLDLDHRVGVATRVHGRCLSDDPDDCDEADYLEGFGVLADSCDITW